jgi:hypothetical protein
MKRFRNYVEILCKKYGLLIILSSEMQTSDQKEIIDIY